MIIYTVTACIFMFCPYTNRFPKTSVDIAPIIDTYLLFPMNV